MLVLFGHLFGDYVFQSKKMALKKSEKSLQGILWCALHSIIYTLSIVIFTWHFSPLYLALIFLSHYPIDRWSLASEWLKIIKGRDYLQAYTDKTKYWEIDVAFSAIVYTVLDNTFHLFLLWLIVTIIK